MRTRLIPLQPRHLVRRRQCGWASLVVQKASADESNHQTDRRDQHTNGEENYDLRVRIWNQSIVLAQLAPPMDSLRIVVKPPLGCTFKSDTSSEGFEKTRNAPGMPSSLIDSSSA